MYKPNKFHTDLRIRDSIVNREYYGISFGYIYKTESEMTEMSIYCQKGKKKIRTADFR